MAVAGFDVGSQTSLFAVPKGGGIEVLLNDYSQRTTPSLVSFGDKHRSLGEGGKLKMVTSFKNTVASFKNLIGRKYDEPYVQEELKRCFFRHTKLEDGTIGAVVNHAGEEHTLSMPQVFGMLLAHLRECVEMDLGTKVTDCVLGVPVIFNDEQRHAMLVASKIAGLKCLRLFNETAAVALSYGIYKKDLPEETEKPRRVVFCDFGHSALQLSLCEYVKGKLKVLAVDAVNVGGRDFTTAILTVMAQRFKESTKLDIYTNPRAYIRLEAECEKLKKLMSANTTEIPINLECLMEERDFSSRFSREEFETECAPLMQRVQDTVTRFVTAVKDLGVAMSDIDAMEVVGGSTRVPAVRDILSKAFGLPLSTTLNCDEAVARGCALMGAMISPTFRVREFKVEDAVPYGVNLQYKKEETGEDQIEPIYAPNSRTHMAKLLSLKRSQPFDINAVYMDPSVVPSAPPLIGTFRVEGVHPSFDNEPQTVKIKVKFDTHGCFFVDSAQIMDKLPVEGDAAATEPKADGMDTAPDVPEPESPAVAEGDATPATPADAAETKDAKKDEPRKKPKTHKTTPLSVVVSKPCLLTDKQLNELVEKELALAQQDKQEKEKADARNALEEFIYDMRDKISTIYEDYIKPDDSEEFRAKLTQMEDWLYEEGEDQPKTVYVEKLTDLQKTGNAVKSRKREFEGRPNAEDALRHSIVHFRKFLNERAAGDAKYAHITDAEAAQVEEAIKKQEDFVNTKTTEQSKLAKFESPAVTVAELEAAKAELERACNKIVNKPVPKVEPPKEEPKPEAEAAPAPAAAEPTADAAPEAGAAPSGGDDAANDLD